MINSDNYYRKLMRVISLKIKTDTKPSVEDDYLALVILGLRHDPAEDPDPLGQLAGHPVLLPVDWVVVVVEHQDLLPTLRTLQLLVAVAVTQVSLVTVGILRPLTLEAAQDVSAVAWQIRSLADGEREQRHGETENEAYHESDLNIHRYWHLHNLDFYS